MSLQSKGEAKPETMQEEGNYPEKCCQNSIIIQEKALGVPHSLVF